MTDYRHRTNDLICHVGFILLAGGLALVALGIPSGWIARIAGDVLFTILGVRTRLTGFIVWSIVFIGIDLYGWLS